MHGDGRIDEVAAQRPELRQNAILVRSRELAISDDIRDQNRRNFPGLAHGAPSGHHAVYHKTRRAVGYMLQAIEPKGGCPSEYSKGGFGSVRPVR